jgi:hypothetical protein
VIERRQVERDTPEEFKTVKDTFEQITPDAEQAVN